MISKGKKSYKVFKNFDTLYNNILLPGTMNMSFKKKTLLSSLDSFFFFKKNIMVSFLNEKFFFFFVKNWQSYINKCAVYRAASFNSYRIFLKAGIDFKHRFSKSLKTNIMSLGRRNRIVFTIAYDVNTFFNLKRRSIYMFSASKVALHHFLIKLRNNQRKTTPYKYKGVMTWNRIIYSKTIALVILFGRHIKFCNIKLRLTKKQKQKRK